MKRGKNKRILVTGGAGFIGSHIVSALVGRGYDVVVYDDMSSGHLENLKRVRDKIEFIKGDILNYKRLLEAMRGCEVVSHHAAQLEIFRCIEDPLMDLKINTLGTLNVLNAAKENGVKKIINASSACVYGQAQSIPETEEHPTTPNWPYGISKLAAENYCRLFYEYYGIEFVNLRYGIVYGPREWYGRVLTCFLKRVMNKQPPIVFGDGTQRRDFVFVEDVVKLHNLCVERANLNNQTFNVATGIGTSIKELAEMVTGGSGWSLKIIFEDVRKGGFSKRSRGRRRIPHELQDMVLGIEKAKRILGWLPKVDLRKGIKLELEWARTNLNKWASSGIVRV